MKLLYLVHFNSPVGGLHENVYASALFMQSKGCEVTVVLKEGILQQRLENRNIRTVTTDFSHINSTIKEIEAEDETYDLVHFHPGPSRKAGYFYGRKYDIPMVMTFHGMWYDSLPTYIDDLSMVVTVSEGVKNFLQAHVDKGREKYALIPNGYDSGLFDEKRASKLQDAINIGLVSRLDQDKMFILEIFQKALEHLRGSTSHKLRFHIIGDGKLTDDFLENWRTLLKNTDHELEFKGWLEDTELKEAYLECDIIIAPGRSVIEAMACGKPVIAVGSKKYIGLIDHENWQEGVYSNFGGYGHKFEDYREGMLEAALNPLINDDSLRKTLGEFGHQIAVNYFDANQHNDRLYNYYRILSLAYDLKK
ncbi:glycosyltransferase family 4 protein [Salinicoccus roseus]|uniref:glycosyltransferase family 4 protein n=1 Tax=Salinicoccus roseus TaxID=45670 RepID=UPI002300415E|nr:glycosyltransferase family 4 protein [Salinicoccus roseus]